MKVGGLNKNIDYQKIWNDQSINSELEECLIDLTKIALDHINNPPPGATSDIKEYSKTEKCWEIFKTVNYDLPANSNKFLISFHLLFDWKHSRIIEKQEYILWFLPFQDILNFNLKS